MNNVPINPKNRRQTGDYAMASIIMHTWPAQTHLHVLKYITRDCVEPNEAESFEANQKHKYTLFLILQTWLWESDWRKVCCVDFWGKKILPVESSAIQWTDNTKEWTDTGIHNTTQYKKVQALKASNYNPYVWNVVLEETKTLEGQGTHWLKSNNSPPKMGYKNKAACKHLDRAVTPQPALHPSQEEQLPGEEEEEEEEEENE